MGFCYRVGLLCFLALFAGCFGRGLRDDGLYVGKYSEYRVGHPEKPWRKISIRDGGDISYLNSELGATLLVSSFCKGVKDSPLTALTQDLLIGMTDQRLVAQRTEKISEREGLISEMTAKIDGVLQSFKMMVVKKDNCVYDIVLSSDPETFDSAKPAFDAVLGGFYIERRSL